MTNYKINKRNITFLIIILLIIIIFGVIGLLLWRLNKHKEKYETDKKNLCLEKKYPDGKTDYDKNKMIDTIRGNAVVFKEKVTNAQDAINYCKQTVGYTPLRQSEYQQYWKDYWSDVDPNKMQTCDIGDVWWSDESTTKPAYFVPPHLPSNPQSGTAACGSNNYCLSGKNGMWRTANPDIKSQRVVCKAKSPLCPSDEDIHVGQSKNDCLVNPSLPCPSDFQYGRKDSDICYNKLVNATNPDNSSCMDWCYLKDNPGCENGTPVKCSSLPSPSLKPTLTAESKCTTNYPYMNKNATICYNNCELARADPVTHTELRRGGELNLDPMANCSNWCYINQDPGCKSDPNIRTLKCSEDRIISDYCSDSANFPYQGHGNNRTTCYKNKTCSDFSLLNQLLLATPLNPVAQKAVVKWVNGQRRGGGKGKVSTITVRQLMVRDREGFNTMLLELFGEPIPGHGNTLISEQDRRWAVQEMHRNPDHFLYVITTAINSALGQNEQPYEFPQNFLDEMEFIAREKQRIADMPNNSPEEQNEIANAQEALAIREMLLHEDQNQYISQHQPGRQICRQIDEIENSEENMRLFDWVFRTAKKWNAEAVKANNMYSENNYDYRMCIRMALGENKRHNRRNETIENIMLCLADSATGRAQTRELGLYNQMMEIDRLRENPSEMAAAFVALLTNAKTKKEGEEAQQNVMERLSPESQRILLNALPEAKRLALWKKAFGPSWQEKDEREEIWQVWHGDFEENTADMELNPSANYDEAARLEAEVAQEEIQNEADLAEARAMPPGNGVNDEKAMAKKIALREVRWRMQRTSRKAKEAKRISDVPPYPFGDFAHWQMDTAVMQDLFYNDPPLAFPEAPGTNTPYEEGTAPPQPDGRAPLAAYISQPPAPHIYPPMDPIIPGSGGEHIPRPSVAPRRPGQYRPGGYGRRGASPSPRRSIISRAIQLANKVTPRRWIRNLDYICRKQPRTSINLQALNDGTGNMSSQLNEIIKETDEKHNWLEYVKTVAAANKGEKMRNIINIAKKSYKQKHNCPENRARNPETGRCIHPITGPSQMIGDIDKCMVANKVAKKDMASIKQDVIKVLQCLGGTHDGIFCRPVLGGIGIDENLNAAENMTDPTAISELLNSRLIDSEEKSNWQLYVKNMVNDKNTKGKKFKEILKNAGEAYKPLHPCKNHQIRNKHGRCEESMYLSYNSCAMKVPLKDIYIPDRDNLPVRHGNTGTSSRRVLDDKISPLKKACTDWKKINYKGNNDDVLKQASLLYKSNSIDCRQFCNIDSDCP